MCGTDMMLLIGFLQGNHSIMVCLPQQRTQEENMRMNDKLI